MMNSWNQNQTMNGQQNNIMMGQAPLNPYINYGWNTPQRAPVYRADPIHGVNAAWQFPISGGEIYLPDADEDIIWWIRVDANGNRQVTPFDVTPHQEPKTVDTQELAARLAAVEEWINGKQNKSNTKRSNTTATNTTSTSGTVQPVD